MSTAADGGPGRLRYLDLDVLIEAEPNGYEARVIDSPVGETGPVSFTAPASDLELENFLLKLGQVRAKVRGGIDSARTAAVKDFGGRLFDALFHDDLLLCLRRSLDRANSEDCGLRLRLRLGEAPKLAEIPWEFLYDKRANRFFCLSGRTPVVRYLELSDAVSRDPMSGPLRMLVMISSPTDYVQLDVDQEWTKVSAAVKNLVDAGRLVVTRLAEPTLDALQRELRRDDYHIFHFVGHGGVDPATGDGVLVLADQDGRGYLESGQDLGAMLLDERSLRLAVLNSCEGARADGSDLFAGSAQALVQQGIPAVVAMQFEITDRSAIAFSRNLYEALADGYPIDAATGEGRKSILALGKTEWATPVLFMRAPDGVLFENLSPSQGTLPQIPAPRSAGSAPSAAPAASNSTTVHPIPSQSAESAGIAASAPQQAQPATGASAGPPGGFQNPPPGWRPPNPHALFRPPEDPGKRRNAAIVAAAVAIAAVFVIGAAVAVGIAAGKGQNPGTLPSQGSVDSSPSSSVQLSPAALENPQGGAGAGWAGKANAACAATAGTVAAAFSNWLGASTSVLLTDDTNALTTASEQLVAATRAQVDSVAAIPPPAEISAQVTQAVKLKREFIAEAERAIGELRAGDVTTYLTRFNVALTSSQQGNQIWTSLGANSCIEGGS